MMGEVALDTKLLRDPKLQPWTSAQRWCWVGCLLIAAESPQPGTLAAAHGPLSLGEIASLLDVHRETARVFLRLAERDRLLERLPDGLLAVRQWGRYQRPPPPSESQQNRSDFDAGGGCSCARDPFQNQRKPKGGGTPQTPLSDMDITPAVAAVYDHWRTARSRTASRYDTISPSRQTVIEARLREFSVAELRTAIDGVAHDPWPDRKRHDDLPTIFRGREQVDRFIDLYERRGLLGGSGRGRSAAEIFALARHLKEERIQ